MPGDYTQESSCYDVIKYDIMANNERLMHIVRPSASREACDSPESMKYALVCHYRQHGVHLLTSHKLEATCPAIVCP